MLYFISIFLKEVAEPLMDLKQAMKEIETNETLRVILSTLRSVGNFLNGVEVNIFNLLSFKIKFLVSLSYLILCCQISRNWPLNQVNVSNFNFYLPNP